MNYLCERDILGSPIMSVSNERIEKQSGEEVGIASMFLIEIFFLLCWCFCPPGKKRLATTILKKYLKMLALFFN